ncbi:hypothetical protein KSS87_012587 [Heliosperma pusillum]|nr:hypothetical protein KSS87_012587 [Heliosperma pusillum]
MANTILLDSTAFPTTHHYHHHHHKSTTLLRPNLIPSFSFSSINPKSPKPYKFKIKFIPKSIHNSIPSNQTNSHLGSPPTTPNPIGYLLNSLNNAFNSLKQPAIVAILLGALLMYDPSSATAASGGRVGGRAFSSRSSMSSSRSYSVRPSSPGFTVPFYGPSPFGGGFYAGPAIGVGVGAGSSLIFVLAGFAAFVLVSGFLSDRDEGGVLTATEKTTVIKLQIDTIFTEFSRKAVIKMQTSTSPSRCVSGPMSHCVNVVTKNTSSKDHHLSQCIVLGSAMLMMVIAIVDAFTSQVGLLGMARSLQSDLNKIAETADTSTPEGLSYVLTETTLSLLRHPDYCISAYSSVDIKRSIDEGERRFNQLSIEERGKFDEETLVNVNNIKRQSSKSTRATGFSNEYIVISILVAAEGVHKLPTINGSMDLKEALQKLASIPSSKTMAVEVLWTPQNENDTLSERELLEDYPLLKPL